MDEHPQTQRSMIHRIIWHPVTQLLVGALIAIGLFYLVERKEIEPRYAVSEPELIAEQTTDAPRLTLYWDGEEIKNAYSVKIAVWNAGRQYLDNNSISETDPLRVICPSGVKILYADFIKISRAHLELNAVDATNTGTNAIYIQIVGDEALEKNDGGILKILFTGGETDGFVVTGRIKGSKQGFVRTKWSSTQQIRSAWTTVLLVGATALSMLVGKILEISRYRNRTITSLLRQISLWMLVSTMASLILLLLHYLTWGFIGPPF